MLNFPTLATERLLLRPWQEQDLAPFAALNADPRVMEYFPKRLERAESDASAGRIGAHFAEHGFGLWAVEVTGGTPFIGFVGLCIPQFEAPFFDSSVEIGWRLACEHWGQGYATEAARAALEFGFARLRLEEIISFTAVANQRSRRVMERIGMTHRPHQDFDHPKIAVGDPLRRHVLYRLARDSWEQARPG